MFIAHATYCDAAGDFCSASECAADPGGCSSYGYGWFLQQEAVGKRYVPLISHSGGIPGFITYNSYYPNQHLTLIALSNLEAFGANIPLMAHEVESDFMASAA